MTRRHRGQHYRQEKRGGKVPAINPQSRPLQKLTTRGMTPKEAIVCGTVTDDDVPVLIEPTGMICGIRKGRQRWVIGSDVKPAIASGGFVVVLEQPEAPPPPKPTRLRDGAPGSAPEIPGRLDQWKIAFTPCTTCGKNPADPGAELCHSCAAAASGESELERALRMAKES